jgi:hypothetical protein
MFPPFGNSHPLCRLPLCSVAAILVVCFLLAGCPMVDLKELRFTRRQPAETEIVGTWRATAETAKEIRDRGGYPIAEHEFVFRADHTFSMRNMPDWWRDGSGNSHGQLESGEGRWELHADDNVWEIWTIRLRFPAGLTSVNLYRQRPPYLIFVRVGDPNNGDAMFFERVSPGQ